MTELNQVAAQSPGDTHFRDDEPVLQNIPLIVAAPVPTFGERNLWALDALGWNPNSGPGMNRIHFARLDPQWNYIARIVAMAMLNPTHHALRDAGIFRTSTPYKPKTVRMMIDALSALALWAEGTGRTSALAGWRQKDFDEYVMWIKENRRPSAVRLAVDTIRVLHRYSTLLPDRGLTFDPWEGRPGVQVAQLKPAGIATPAIPPEVWWPLIRACWQYIDVFSADLFAAQDLWTALKSRAGRITQQETDEALQGWIVDQDSFVPVHVASYAAYTAGEIHWALLSRLITGGRSDSIFANLKSRGYDRRATILNAVGQGLPRRSGGLDVPISSVEFPDGAQRPWIAGLDPTVVTRELKILRNACYIFCAALTMMRDSELQSIKPGALTTFYGAPAVRSALHKHAAHGTERHWWITEPVAKAITVAERLTIHHDRLFGSMRKSEVRELRGFDQHDEVSKFIRQINQRCTETGLQPIPEHRLAPHMFRRTMSIITAQQPDGEIALGITLKHSATRALANAATSGYAADTAEWAKEFEHELQESVAAGLVAQWAQRDAGYAVARGPGAHEFVRGFDAVSDRLDTGVRIGDQRMLRDFLRDEFSQLRLGTLNHCLGDPSKAACLAEQPDSVKRHGVIPSMCQPATCRNSVITEEHMPIWLAEEHDLMGKLRDRRMAPVHRQRLQQQLLDVRTITQQEAK